MTVPTYSLAERDRRWALARELMAAEGLDALLVYGEHHLVHPAPHAHDVYFTNDRPGAIVIFCRDADPIVLVGTPMAIGDHIEARRRGEATWIQPGNMRIARSARGVIDVLREHALQRSAIGVIGIDPAPPWHAIPIMPHALWQALTEALPDARFTGVYGAFVARAAPQSAEEQAVLTHAARIGDAMGQAMLEAAKPGITEADIMTAGMAEAYRQGAIAPPMLLQCRPGTISWGGPAYAYRPQPPRTIAEGDLVLADVFTCFGMRESQLQVTIAVGDVHPDAEQAALVARTSYEAGLHALRPGRSFGHVVEAMRRPVIDAGGWNVHPLVHGVYPYGPVGGWGAGLRGRPEAAEYGLLAEVATIGGETPLVPGMAFSIEPNCVIGNHTVTLGGTVIAGETEPIELNPFTAQMLRAG